MIEFVTDPLRLTLIVAGVVVLFAILILGRRSKHREVAYKGRSEKDYSFGVSPPDTLVDEEVVVLPRRKKESEVLAEKTPHFSANYDEPVQDKISEQDITAKLDAFVASPGEVVGKAYTVSAGPVVDENKKSRYKADQIASKKDVEAPLVNTIERALESAMSKKPKAAQVSKGAQVSEGVEVSSKAETSNQVDTSFSDSPSVDDVTPAKRVTQQFVVLHIIAEEGRPFIGKAIFDATQTLGMALGKHNVFHYPADAAYVGDSAFCLVNMTPAGTFDIESLDQQQTNGVSLILTLPTAYSDGLTVFSNMVAVAHALVKKLGGGDIVDQTRLPLTAELLTNMQSDITRFENQLSESASAH